MMSIRAKKYSWKASFLPRASEGLAKQAPDFQKVV